MILVSTIALVVSFILVESKAFTGAVPTLEFHKNWSTSAFYLAEWTTVFVWIRIASAFLTGAAMFFNPHRNVGHIAGRSGFLFAIDNIAWAAYLILASYVGGDYPQTAWAVFVISLISVVINVLIIIALDLGLTWNEKNESPTTWVPPPMKYLFDTCCGRSASYDKVGDESMGLKAADDYDDYISSVRSKEVTEQEPEPVIDNKEGMDGFIDTSAANSTHLRKNYTSGSSMVHFWLIEFPISFTASVAMYLFFVYMVYEIDYSSASPVSEGVAILFAIIIFLLILAVALVKGLVGYLLGSIWMIASHYAGLNEYKSFPGLETALIIFGILLILGTTGLVIARVYHSIRRFSKNEIDTEEMKNKDDDIRGYV